MQMIFFLLLKQTVPNSDTRYFRASVIYIYTNPMVVYELMRIRHTNSLPHPLFLHLRCSNKRYLLGNGSFCCKRCKLNKKIFLCSCQWCFWFRFCIPERQIFSQFLLVKIMDRRVSHLCKMTTYLADEIILHKTIKK